MVFLDLDKDETIVIEDHYVKWVVETPEGTEENSELSNMDCVLNTLMLTDKKVLCTYETATEYTKGRIFKRKATKKTLHMIDLKLSDIKKFDGQVAVKEDGSTGNGLLTLETSRGKEYFLFNNKANKHIKEWMEELNRLVPPAREALSGSEADASLPKVEPLSQEPVAESASEPAAEPLKSASQS